MAHPELPARLARLNEGDEGRAIAFAQTWGLISAYGSKAPSSSAGDPLVWLWAHARGTRAVLQLQRYLSRDDVEGLETYLRTLVGPTSSLRDIRELEGRLEVVRLAYGAFNAVKVEEGHFAVGTELAHRPIESVLNANLAGVSRQILFEDGDPNERQKSVAPIAGAYWHLADIITRGRRLARCEECGSVFVQRDRRQRFCPPPSDWYPQTS